MKVRIWGIAVVATLVVCPGAGAAPGDLDPSFSRDGKVSFGFGGVLGNVHDVAVDDQGRILIAGSSGGQSGTSSSSHFAVARLTPTGELDRNFNATGIFTSQLGILDSARAIVPAPGGGAYVAIGEDGVPNSELSVVRLGDDGRPDPAFAGDGIASVTVADSRASANDLAIAPDGGVIVVGTAGPAGGADLILARFGPDGAPNPALGGDGVARSDLGRSESAAAIAIDSSGRIVVSGRFDVSEPLIARYTPSGDLDTGFSENGFATEQIYAPGGFSDVVILTDGRIAAAATGIEGSFLLHQFSVLYLRVFSEAGEQVAATQSTPIQLGGLVAQPDGALAMAYTLNSSGRGGSAPRDFMLDRLLAGGEHDPGFGSGAKFAVETDFERTSESATAIAAAPDGRLVVAGAVGPALESVGVARYLNAPGPRDPDADGVLGEADRCGRSFGTAKRFGCAVLERRISLSADDGPKQSSLLRGELTGDCVTGVKVRAFLKRQGRDRFVGADTTNGNADFAVRGLRQRGRYYATTKETFTVFGLCEAERSRTVRVGPGD